MLQIHTNKAALAESLALEVSNLQLSFDTDRGTVQALHDMSLRVSRGTTHCVVGESGSGKSIMARALLGLLPSAAHLSGSILYHGTNGAVPQQLVGLDQSSKTFRRLRGAEISMIFQEPMAAFSPVHSIGDHLVEMIRNTKACSRKEAEERAIAGLDEVGIPNPSRRMKSYPFELSGGQLQRAMIAVALASEPSLLVADEPTTALDVTMQAQVLDLLSKLREERDMALVFVTHDLGVVAQIADEVTVVYAGETVESGSVEEIFAAPQHPYTQGLLKAIPSLHPPAGRRHLPSVPGVVPAADRRPAGCALHPRCPIATPGLCDRIPPQLEPSQKGKGMVRCHNAGQLAFDDEPALELQREAIAPGAALLELRDLSKTYHVRSGRFGSAPIPLKALDGVSLTVRRGETYGIVGESGCGKSTLARAVLGIAAPSAGQIAFDGANATPWKKDRNANRAFWTRVRFIFQDPFGALNPRFSVFRILADPLIQSGLRDQGEIRDRVNAALCGVGLSPSAGERYPHAFSGGQRQRIVIARAMILNPELVVADEAVSALDVSVRAQVLNLLSDLKSERQLTMLFISHDLSVIRHVSDRVGVMYLGRLVEEAPAAELYVRPLHPYTETLLSAVPQADPTRGRSKGTPLARGEVPDAMNAPSGCHFHPRCPYATALCSSKTPALTQVGDRRVACHYADTLSLQGA
ncbi:ABC transporter ATP-binding protein [Devosia sp. 2618]|uniref:ABC transporter ATP-binding protein n=1 Tax=Devosia sp. 2618 TaxID=3156454 RepID=UPI0033926BFB